MSRLKDFSATNPTGSAPGMETLNHDVIRAAVENVAPAAVVAQAAPTAPAKTPLVPKTIRLPADLVDFIDYEYRPRHRKSQQEAYTEALEAFFRPMMGRR